MGIQNPYQSPGLQESGTHERLSHPATSLTIKSVSAEAGRELGSSPARHSNYNGPGVG